MNGLDKEFLEHFIQDMKDAGATKVLTIAKVAKRFDVDLGAAKLFVHESRAWRESKEAHEEFVASVVKVIENPDAESD